MHHCKIVFLENLNWLRSHGRLSGEDRGKLTP
jgi:hypothetical protein